MEIPTIERDKKGRFSAGGAKYTKIVLFLIALVGVVTMLHRGMVWSASHQLIGQSVVKQALQLQAPIRIEDVQPQVIISPIVERFGLEELTPIEEKILDKWGYKEGVIALAVFQCESGFDQYAVSRTGDLGIAQINWSTHKAKIIDRGKTSSDLLTDVDFNLEIAHAIWEASGWNAWSAYNNGSYLSCLQ